MKNHKSRPTIFTPFSEANGTSFHGNKRNRGCGCGCGRGRKKNYRGQEECTDNSYKINAHFHQKWNHTEAKQKEYKSLQNKPTKN
jgi:hypothetical protein